MTDFEEQVSAIVKLLKQGVTVEINTVNLLPFFMELESRKDHYGLPCGIRVKQGEKKCLLRLKSTQGDVE